MKPKTIISPLLGGALLILCITSQTLANSVNSNSTVKDGIEYYVQTDKAVYEAGETVQILYRVTNLGSEAVTFRFTCGPVTDRCDFMVEKGGQRIWDNLGRPATLALTSFTLDPSGSNSFTIIWDMTDANDNQIVAGGYEVTAALSSLYLSDDKYVPVSVTITITPTTLLVPDDYPTIQQAIDAAYDGDTVIVADGTYTGEGNRDIDFLGKAITVRSESGPNNCVIDCNSTEGKSHKGFYFHTAEDTNSVLEGFTITNGFGPGGGILCLNSSPLINNCTITGNSSEYDSGGICFENSSAIITNCTISNNSAREGGGISCFQSSVVITNCTISDNSAEDIGGGIFCYNSSPRITDCTLAGNLAERSGGAISCYYDSSLTITNCTITGNSAATGGAIHCYESNAAVSNCILSDNMAEIGSEIAITSTHSDLPCILTLKYTDIQGGRANVFVGNWSTLNSGPGNIDADPRFVEPGYWDHNGTPNYIWDDFWVNGDYHLLETSPCVDAGDPNYSPGPNETDLDGNPRITGYAVDMGAYEYPLPLVAQIHIRPRTINLRSQGKWLTCRISLPDGYNAADIDPDTILLEDEIEPVSFRIHSGASGAVAFFSRRDLQDILGPGRVELTITGQLTDGTAFMATDTIKVMDNPPPKPARTRKPKVNLRPSRRTKIAIG